MVNKGAVIMNYIIPIITLIIGIIVGFLFGVYYLRKQMMNMSMDNKNLQEMAKKMGINLNQQQINQANKMMKTMNKKK